MVVAGQGEASLLPLAAATSSFLFCFSMERKEQKCQPPQTADFSQGEGGCRQQQKTRLTSSISFPNTTTTMSGGKQAQRGPLCSSGQLPHLSVFAWRRRQHLVGNTTTTQTGVPSRRSYLISPLASFEIILFH